jgi:hypothetical protein
MWTDEACLAFIQIVLAESRRLGRTDSGFKKTSWTKILLQFNNQLGPQHSIPRQIFFSERTQTQRTRKLWLAATFQSVSTFRITCTGVHFFHRRLR